MRAATIRWHDDGKTLTVAGEQHGVFAPGQRCLLAARPEHFSIGADEANTIEAKVLDVTYRGSAWSVDLSGGRGEALTALVRAGGAVPAKGDVVPLTWAAARCFLLEGDEPPRTQPLEQQKIEANGDS